MPKRKTKKGRQLYRASAAAFRWLHIYLSMLGFAALMFFSFTGITLNHPTWFGASEQSIEDRAGNLATELLAEPVEKLVIAETIRAEHSLRGRVSEFEVDEYECFLVFKGPGYAADVFVDRESGKYTVSEITSGAMAVMNDLHKGRDSGAAWAVLIDVTAVLMMLLSLSGFGLLFYLKRRRVSGTLTAVVGTVALFAVWAVWVR
ncbi:MAG: PepSY-associated TM helix domain-containing protein [Planctomycetota bacterium]